jgi:predicted outer membrane repeat protein
MSFMRWLRNLQALGNRPSGSDRRTGRKARAQFRPRLEVLEGRVLPATTFTVNLGTDAAGPGGQQTGPTSGDLRWCVSQADLSDNAGSTIDFANTLDNTTVTLQQGELPLSQSMRIAGPGAGLLTVSGNHASRVFDVSAGTVTLSGLTIADGNPGDDGGGIFNAGTLAVAGCILSGNSAFGYGGGIDNMGMLAVTDSTFSANTAGAVGGGIANLTALTVTGCTFSGNSAPDGGAIGTDGTLTLANSTITGNSASDGGAINNFGTLAVTNSTLAGNSADRAGGIFQGSGTATVGNTILAGNTAAGSAPDVFGAVASQGHNLVGDPAGGSGFVATDLLGLDPLLGPLQDNGGLTQTMALLPGSPAIDAGSNALVPAGLTADQRGLARIVGGAVDIGAFERQAPALTVPGPQTAEQDVALAIPGISVTDVDSNTLTVTLTVGHGTLTLASTAGLSATGNGTAAVTLSGSLADLNAALASLAYQGNLHYSGSDTLGITATDGSLSTQASVAITVQSVAQEATSLQAQVNALYAAGVLNKGQANALDVKLRLQGNGGDSGRVQSFLNQVEAWLAAGILTPAQANALLTAGQALLAGLTTH